MKVADFDYDLPQELIAQDPLEPRDASRLLIMARQGGGLRHSHFYRLGEELRPHDILVINDTKVLPARLFARRKSGAAVEVMLLRQLELDLWQCLVKPGKKALPGAELFFDLPELTALVEGHGEDGTRLIRFRAEGDFWALLDRLGTMPLPPYIKKPLVDQDRYQPVYAREKGSVAAPTAGLHFTPRLMDGLQGQGIQIAKVMLHVGLGTFRPVKSDTVEGHTMHDEFYRVPQQAADAVNAARAKGGRVIAVGTTAVRTLETVAAEDGSLTAAEGWTHQYIYPGYRFKIVDGLITNFHLPKSTLIMLVSAFAGREQVLAAYRAAIAEQYRFYSFGDAMLIL